MTYWMRSDLSFCQMGDHLIFLDVERDRYFRLPYKLERAFMILAAGGVCEEPDVQRLIKAGILTTEAGPAIAAPAEVVEPACRSAVELFAESPPRKLNILPEVGAIVFSTRLQLATRPLKTILERLVAVRRRLTSRSPYAAPNSDHTLVEAATAFRHMRLYVPIPTRCLLDSISIVRFLARRGLSANIVFGVTSAPFSAHCWAQAKDLVLNDSLGNVVAYTQIRAV